MCLDLTPSLGLAKPVTDYFGLERDSAVTVETINV